MKTCILTFVIITLVTILAGSSAFQYYYTSAKKTQLQASTTYDKVIERLQQSIHSTDAQSIFASIHNTAGISNSHTLLAEKKAATCNSRFGNSGSPQHFQDIFKNSKLVSGIRFFSRMADYNAKIVNVYPIKVINWVVACYINIAVLQAQLGHLYQNFLAGILLLVFIISGCSIWLIRLMYNRYGQAIDIQITSLNDQIKMLGRLNQQLESKQQNVASEANILSVPAEETTRKRIITYQKDEIVTIDVGNIVYASVLNDTVSVQTFQNKTYTLNNSLDDLMSQLDNKTFYRANRQYIVNINAIETILIQSNNKLSLDTKPKSPEPIIIGKNKVAEFKKWLDR